MKNEVQLRVLVKASYDLENYITDIEYLSDLPELEKTARIDIAQYNLRTALVMMRGLLAEHFNKDKQKSA